MNSFIYAGGHVIFHSKYSFGKISPLFNFVFISHHSERKSLTNPYSKVNAIGEPVMKRLGIELDGDELYEAFQKFYYESVGRDVDKDKMWNMWRLILRDVFGYISKLENY